MAKRLADNFKRKHKQGFLFNALEQEALDAYCKKYKVKNKSQFMRELVVSTILKRFDTDYPSLFDQVERRKHVEYIQGVLAFKY